MNIDSFNDRIIDLWCEYKKVKKLTLLPYIYSEPERYGILFLTLNPAFRKNRKDKELYKIANINNKNIEIIKKLHKEHLNNPKHPFFGRLRKVAEYVGFPQKWDQSDLFFLRQTDSEKLYAKILDKDNLNEFGRKQLEISVDIIKYIKPEIIVVGSKKALKILMGKKGKFSLDINVDVVDNKSDTYILNIKKRKYRMIYRRLIGPYISESTLQETMRDIKNFVNS